MTQTTSSYSLAILLLIGAVSGACTRSIEVLPSPHSDAPAVTTAIANAERVPLVLDPAKLSQNGAPQNPSIELDRRLLGSLQSLNLFSHLALTEQAPFTSDEKTIVARLSIDDTIDSHPGAAAWKGFAIGGSMFLLSPVIDFHYDYGTHLTLELERWDGTVKTYHAASTGTARYNLFSASPSMIAELKGHVMETGMNDLMYQVVRDATFYNASSAPMTERTIHSVSVRSKRSAPAAIPISTSTVNELR